MTGRAAKKGRSPDCAREPALFARGGVSIRSRQTPAPGEPEMTTHAIGSAHEHLPCPVWSCSKRTKT